MKEFTKVNCMDLFDDFPKAIIEEWREQNDGDYRNESYTWITVSNKDSDDILATYLFNEGYPVNEKCLIIISW